MRKNSKNGLPEPLFGWWVYSMKELSGNIFTGLGWQKAAAKCRELPAQASPCNLLIWWGSEGEGAWSSKTFPIQVVYQCLEMSKATLTGRGPLDASWPRYSQVELCHQFQWGYNVTSWVSLSPSFPVNSSWLENQHNAKNKANVEIKAYLQIHIHLTELQQFSSKLLAHQSEEQTVNLTSLRQTQHKKIKCKFLLLPVLSGHPCSVHQHALVFLPTLPICWCS